MVQPLTVWLIAVSILVSIVLLKVIRTLYKHTKFSKSHKFIDVATDDEIFYCPGDKDEYCNDRRR